jgi:ABC-type Fe3+/spermidine/putrescine transport system ATPase subunit
VSTVSRPLVDIRLEGIDTRGGVAPGVNGVSVHVRYGEFFTFLGPPKSGKSDVLRAVAGFLPITRGRVLVDGQDISTVPPRSRGVGYVFQDGALWPHMRAREHVAYGLRQQGLAKDEIERRVGTVLARLGLGDAAALKPVDLSLEQRRRLALARALAIEPKVLLLDEPLANLDPTARKALRLELTKLHRDLAVTTIHATRNAADALALSDRLAVIDSGRVLQVGDPAELYHQPQTRAAAEALGPASFLPVRVVDRVPVAGRGAYRLGDRGLLVLRPETLSMSEAAMARGPGIPGRVALRVFEGARHLYEIEIGTRVPVRVELPAASEERVFRLGDRVRVEISSETVVLVPDA